MDHILANLLEQLRTPKITEAFLAITSLGKLEVVITFLICIILLLIIYKKWSSVSQLLVAVLGSQSLIWLAKIFFQRERPGGAVYLESSFSFPSGHAAIAIVFYGFVTILVYQNIKPLVLKKLVVFVLITIIFLIGFSRMYLGVHYLSDVFAGYLLGLTWLGISVLFRRIYMTSCQPLVTN